MGALKTTSRLNPRRAVESDALLELMNALGVAPAHGAILTPFTTVKGY
jgi:hypothetical protein